MKRALLLVLDSVGCGHAPDAAAYGDAGADTLGHIYRSIPGFSLPNLEALGLGRILGLDGAPEPRASWGRMSERSAGKDTTTGHFELAGQVLDQPFATFEKFPDALVTAIERETSVKFIGNYPQSGTTVLEELGAQHLETGNPILYTSADSVLQIAAHKKVMPVRRLNAICKVARRHADAYRIGRVISRPFEGKPGAFKRLPDRRDFAMSPGPNVLNALSDNRYVVRAIGKIFDIFAGSGFTHHGKTTSNRMGMEHIRMLWPNFCGRRGGLLFANLVDFDMLFGHRRDVAGYAKALKEFDHWLGGFLRDIHQDDLVIITADHGNDPTWKGTDHTREQVPLIVLHGGQAVDLGTRDTFADVAATLTKYFDLTPWPVGQPFI
jgi:phosphopentomutase